MSEWVPLSKGVSGSLGKEKVIWIKRGSISCKGVLLPGCLCLHEMRAARDERIGYPPRAALVWCFACFGESAGGIFARRLYNLIYVA